jgi:hypothetical protein
VEYFTIGHPPVFNTDSPTLLALGWGIIATWWVGVMLGVPLGFAARVGTRNKRTTRSFIRPILILLLIMAVCASMAGLIGGMLASRGIVHLSHPLNSRVPADKHIAFIAAGAAHLASYAVGFVGGVVLIIITIMSRFRPQRQQQQH